LRSFCFQATTSRRRSVYRNLQNALAELLSLGVVPIVNENDSVSVRELEGAFAITTNSVRCWPQP